MWFGREGRHGVCRVANSCCDFQTSSNPNAYRMYAFHRQLFNHDHVNSFSSKKKSKKKKTIKKLVKHLKL